MRSAIAVAACAALAACPTKEQKQDQSSANPTSGDGDGDRTNPPASDREKPMTADSEILEIVEGATLADLTWPKGKARMKLGGITDAADKLQVICLDSSTSAETRFKACEALLTLGAGLPDDPARAEAATAYAEAMATATTHNAWSLPETVKSSSTSRHLIALGRPALPALVPLLDNDKPLLYEGSEEPTISEMRDYRVYDLAAAIIAEITGASYPSKEDDPAVRKKAAEGLKSAN